MRVVRNERIIKQFINVGRINEHCFGHIPNCVATVMKSSNQNNINLRYMDI